MQFKSTFDVFELEYTNKQIFIFRTNATVIMK